MYAIRSYYAPVSRVSVLAAKMTAAALVAAANAAVYMFAFSKFMSGITGGELENSNASAEAALANLGMKLQGMDYVMLVITSYSIHYTKLYEFKPNKTVIGIPGLRAF